MYVCYFFRWNILITLYCVLIAKQYFIKTLLRSGRKTKKNKKNG